MGTTPSGHPSTTSRRWASTIMIMRQKTLRPSGLPPVRRQECRNGQASARRRQDHRWLDDLLFLLR